MKPMVRSKASDFEVLKQASNTLIEYFRMDETVPDLADQISSTEPGAHKYFIEPYNTMLPVQMFTKTRFIPLPTAILNNYNGIECASFMGLIPEINRAWITIDHKLYLWDYLHPNDFLVFEDSKEVIISVSLSAPKPGVFTNDVKYVLIVATPVEVMLLALIWDTDLSQLRMQPTTYAIPSDNTTMFKVIGSQSGRIFMGGSDGNVYELDYQNLDSTWSVLGPSRKCRKLNHSAWHWKLVHIVPPFLRELAGWNDSLADMVVDDCRKLVYSVTANGDMSAFYLGGDSKSITGVVTAFNVFQESYACIVSRPRESSPKADYFKNTPMQIVGVFVLPITESRQLHLVVVLSTGIRVFISVRATDGQYYFRDGSNAAPSSLKVAYVRSPPPGEAIVASMKRTATRESTFLPTYLPSQPMNAHTAYYSHGVLLSAVGTESSADKILGITEDLVIRAGSLAGASSVSVPAFREAVGVLGNEGAESKVYDIKEACTLVHHPDALTLRTSFVASKSPANNPLSPDPRISAPTSESIYPGFGPGLGLPSSGRGLGGPIAGTVAVVSEFASQMAPSTRMTKRQFLCLLNNGLVVLHKNRPIDMLYRILEANCAGEEYLQQARHFFTCFGLMQSSTMCIAIACNLPPDFNAEVDENALPVQGLDMSLVQRRALTVLQRLGENTSYRLPASAQIMQDSRFSTAGSTGFTMSSFHDAMHLFFSRVVRPIWYKGAIAKAKLTATFLSRKVLSSIRVPLISLRALILNYFSSVVKVDVVDLKKGDDDGVGSLLLRQIQLQTKVQDDQDKLLRREAKRKEDCAVHGLFRLVSRSIQALSLFDILIAAESEMKIAIPWSRLENLTFQSIVSSAECHERIQKLLDATLELISVSKLGISIGDRLTDLLSTHCFAYFSAGDRYRYEASKLIAEVVEYKAGSSGSTSGAVGISGYDVADVESAAGKAISLMMKASRYWRSLDDVTPSMTAGTITPSTLKKCCLELTHLGVTGRDAVVDMCLQTADNFVDASTLKAAGSVAYITGAEDDWERELYHGGGVSTADDKAAGRRACYQCLLEEIKAVAVSHMKGIGGGIVSLSAASSVVPPDQQNKVIMRMIERAMAATKDVTFLEMLYDSLYEWNKDILLRLSSKSVETYLIRKDSNALFSYFGNHHRSVEACDLAAQLALTDNDMDINERIHYLTLANTTIVAMGIDDESSAKAIELQDRLIVAEFQRNILSVLSSDLEGITSIGGDLDAAQRRSVDALAGLVRSLRYRLKSIGDLYLEATEPYKLWENSLQLLFAAKSDDYSLIVRLWKSVIYRLVPAHSDNFEMRLFLQSKRTPQNIEVDARKQRSDVLFESSTAWLIELLDKVASLGCSLRGNESELGFPLSVIVEELEDIVLQLNLADVPIERSLVPQTFIRVGVSYENLLQSYTSVLSRWENRKVEAIVSVTSSALVTLVDWIQRASGASGASSTELKLFYLAVRGHKVHSWLDRIRHALNSIPMQSMLSSRVFRPMLEVSREDMTKIDLFITSVTIA